MPRPWKGVYVVGDRVVRWGYRDRDPRGAEEFHVVTASGARALLHETDDFADLAWRDANIVRRTQSEIDARVLRETKDADDTHFERERGKAVLLVLLDEINVLRQAAGLTPRTIQQVKNAYKVKLNQ